jgi:hypothetical protein
MKVTPFIAKNLIYNKQNKQKGSYCKSVLCYTYQYCLFLSVEGLRLVVSNAPTEAGIVVLKTSVPTAEPVATLALSDCLASLAAWLRD